MKISPLTTLCRQRSHHVIWDGAKIHNLGKIQLASVTRWLGSLVILSVVGYSTQTSHQLPILFKPLRITMCVPLMASFITGLLPEDASSLDNTLLSVQTLLSAVELKATLLLVPQLSGWQIRTNSFYLLLRITQQALSKTTATRKIRSVSTWHWK